MPKHPATRTAVGHPDAPERLHLSDTDRDTIQKALDVSLENLRRIQAILDRAAGL